MRTKATTYALLTLAAFALTVPASAQMGSLDAVGELGGIPNLQAMVKQALAGGRTPEGVTVDKLDNGLIKVAIPLREDSPVFRQKRAKNLINCAITVELFEPDFAAQLLTFDVAPLTGTEYFAGWVTINTSDNDIDATSSIKTKGPGPDINSGNQTLTYDASAFVLFFTNTAGFDGGLHGIDVKVKGAKPGKLKGNFCAGCAG